MLVKEMKDIVEIFYFLEIKYSNLNNYSEATRPDPTQPNPTNVLLKYGNTENCWSVTDGARKGILAGYSGTTSDMQIICHLGRIGQPPLCKLSPPPLCRLYLSS